MRPDQIRPGRVGSSPSSVGRLPDVAEDGDPEIELTGARRNLHRFFCGLLAALAAVAMLGVLFGSVKEPGPEGPLRCASGEFPIFCDHEGIPEWHALIGRPAGVFLVLLTAA